MAVVAARAQEPRVADRDVIELLQRALDPGLLAELGWDPETLLMHPVPEHPVFGYSVCDVVGCSRPVRQRGGLCEGCRHRYERGVVAGRLDDLDAFKRTPRPGLRSREEEPCLVCRTDPDHYRPALGRTGLCKAHARQCRRLGVAVEEFVVREDARPHPTFGECRRRGCGRRARGGDRLCEQCAGVWYRRGRPDLDLFCAESPPLAGVVPAVSLDGFPERVRLELLYVAQSLVATNLASARHYWNELVLAARVEGVAALEELRDVERRRCTRRAMKALGVLYADQEEEFAQDVWDLHKLGLAVQHVAALDFTVIHQGWLRDAAKAWAREKLLTVSPGTLRSFLVTLGLVSEVLRARPDGGEAPRTLARSDMRAFRERLGRLHAAGRVPDTYFYHGPTRVRQFLREGAAFGLFDRGGPLHGLSADFAVLPQDIPKRAKEEDEDVGRSLPQVVVDQLLSERYLARMADRFGEDMRTLIQVLADTGRRPDEACALRAICLEKSEFIDSETGELQAAWILIHDMPKVGITNYRLAIAQSTAQVIIAQRERAQARYPDTPLSDLLLFPRELQNAYGIFPVKSRRLNQVVRGWVDALPELVGPAGEQYPRERVIPYAFRHSFAQRHADNGTPIDVLADMMGHRTIDTTRGYYKVNKARMRKAVATVSEMQLNHRGNRVTANLGELVDAEYDRYQVGQIAVAFGTCHEPSNVKSSGQSCPYRFRCFGCTHFRTDPSYLAELREHLQRLLVDHERLNAATDGMLEDWARRDALPAPQEIVAVRRLIRAAEAVLDGLTPEERAAVDELFAVIRRARANIDTALPAHFSGGVRQPRPTIYPQPAVAASGS